MVQAFQSWRSSYSLLGSLERSWANKAAEKKKEAVINTKMMSKYTHFGPFLIILLRTFLRMFLRIIRRIRGYRPKFSPQTRPHKPWACPQVPLHPAARAVNYLWAAALLLRWRLRWREGKLFYIYFYFFISLDTFFPARKA